LRQSGLAEADEEVRFFLLVALLAGERKSLLVVVDSFGVPAYSLQCPADAVQRWRGGTLSPGRA
jgi:hypothetical protein